jgi:hypothetical protein
MTVIDPDTVLGRVDVEHINRVARAAAQHLTLNDVAHLIIEPGDVTRYVITLTRRSAQGLVTDPNRASITPQASIGWDWFTVSATPHGTPYPWQITNPPHHSYVHEHMVHDPYTAVIVAEVLSRVSEHWAAGVDDAA